MVAGLGCLGATFVAGTLLVRKGILPPDGSITQTGAGKLAAAAGLPQANLASLLGLTPLDNLVFGAWSVFPDTAVEIARLWSLLNPEEIEAVFETMAVIEPVKGVFNPAEVLDKVAPTYVKVLPTKADLAAALEQDLMDFQAKHGCRHSVVVWCGSNELVPERSKSHSSIAAFEAGLRANDPAITSSQIYAWACVRRGTPFASGSPNRSFGFAAINQLAASTGTPLAGESFQPVSYRVLDLVSEMPHPDGVPPPSGWKDPLRPKMDEELIHWSVRAEVVAQRAKMPIEDAKRTTPAILDVVLLLDLARRAGMSGTQNWLDIFFAAPAGRTLPEEQAGALRETLMRLLKTQSP